MKKNIIIKTFSVLLSSFVILGCFTACGDTSEIIDEPTSIVEEVTKNEEKVTEEITTTVPTTKTPSQIETTTEKITEKATTTTRSNSVSSNGPPVSGIIPNRSPLDDVTTTTPKTPSSDYKIVTVNNSKILIKSNAFCAMTIDQDNKTSELKSLEEINNVLSKETKQNLAKYCFANETYKEFTAMKNLDEFNGEIYVEMSLVDTNNFGDTIFASMTTKSSLSYAMNFVCFYEATSPDDVLTNIDTDMMTLLNNYDF